MVIVIIILAGISINALIGDNGLILRTGDAKERAEIAGEKDIIEQSTIDAIEKDKFRELTYAKFTKYMNINLNDGVEVENVDGDFYVTFKESQRIYKVDKDGNIKYLGRYSELASKATITASPEEDTYPKTAQEIDITVTTIVKREEDEVVIHYGWSKDKNIEATNYIELEASIDTTQRKRTGKAIIEDEEGSYYLWVKVLIDNNVVTQKFGPYAIKSHTALVPTTSEDSATAGFLGSNKFENSKEVTRDRINSVKITDTFTDENGVTHTINDSNCWDVSVAQDKKSILAWFEVAKDKNGNEVKNADNKTMYNITIAQEGGVTAAKDSRYLFYNVGQGGTGENVITGLEYLDTRETTNFKKMFAYCAAKTLNLSKFDTSKAVAMEAMFTNCKSLTSIDLSNFNTEKVTNMYYMFSECNNLERIDVNIFNTENVTRMDGMFYRMQ